MTWQSLIRPNLFRVYSLKHSVLNLGPKRVWFLPYSIVDIRADTFATSAKVRSDNASLRLAITLLIDLKSSKGQVYDQPN